MNTMREKNLLGGLLSLLSVVRPQMESDDAVVAAQARTAVMRADQSLTPLLLDERDSVWVTAARRDVPTVAASLAAQQYMLTHAQAQELILFYQRHNTPTSPEPRSARVLTATSEYTLGRLVSRMSMAVRTPRKHS